MEEILHFLRHSAVPELANITSDVIRRLDKLGVNEYLFPLEDNISMESNYEPNYLVDQIIFKTNEACSTAFSKLYLIPNSDNTIVKNRNILVFLDLLENSIESKSILSLVDHDLDPIDQLAAWAEFLAPEIKQDIEESVESVLDTLIDNVIDIHEYRIDVEPVAPKSDLFLKKVNQLKAFKELTTSQGLNPLVLDHVRTNGFDRLLSTDEVSKRFLSKIVELDQSKLTIELIGLAIITNAPLEEIAMTAKEFANEFVSDIRLSMRIMDEIDNYIAKNGTLWTTQAS